MQTKKKTSNMENTAQISGIESSRQTLFEGVTVSVGFIRYLQDTVLQLERNQQNFIKQLDHANSLATEYHETASMYQRKYDTVLHEMQELKHQHIREVAELFEKLDRAEEEICEERTVNEEHAQRIKSLQQQLTECIIEKNDREARRHDDYDEGENCANDEIFVAAAASAAATATEYKEEMSPVSVASPSPREEQRPPIQSFNRCYSESEDEYEYEYNEECNCYQCRELYADYNNPDTNTCSCDDCCSSQSSQEYTYDVDGNRYVDGIMVPGQSDTDGSDDDYE
jgi:hypothetical protein